MVSNKPQSEFQEIKVEILLTGGHQYTVYFKPDSPILELLAKTLISKYQKSENSVLFQIPLSEGRSNLCFSSEHLVGIVTEPSFYLSYLESQGSKDDNPKIYTNTEFSVSPKTDNLESRYLLIENFLTKAENEKLFDHVLQKESDFVPATTSTKQENYRSSLVLYSFTKFQELIVHKIRETFPSILNKLNIPEFSIAEIESQITAHNDNNFYKIHNDNGSPEVETRIFTYVYYFYQEPKKFTGGELRIYDSRIQEGYYVKAETFKSIRPKNNSIVFFLSRYMHEVLPVVCPSQNFADSRFTVNGWIRRS